MELIKLEGKNFRQYKTLGPIDFPEKGVIGIVGDNGSGKSTIFNAIEIALFGRSSEIKNSEIKRQGAASKDRWSVELTFRFNNIEYKVERHEVTANASLTADGELIQKGQRAVTEHIEEILRMNQEAFLNAFYAKQNEIERLNSLTNEARKREISTLLGIDEIDKAIMLSRKDKNELNIKIGELKRFVMDDDELNKKKKELEKTKKKAAEAKSQQESSLKKKKTELIKLEKEIESLKKQEKEFLKLNSDQRSSSEKINHLKDNIKSLSEEIKSIQALNKKIQIYSKEIKEIESLEKKISLSKKMIDFNTRKKEMEEKIKKEKDNFNKLNAKLREKEFSGLNEREANTQKKLQKVEEEIQKLKIKENTISNEISRTTAEGKRIRTQLEEIKVLGEATNCPTCKQKIGAGVHNLIEQFNKELNETIKKYKNDNTQKANIEAKLTKLGKRKDAVQTELDGVTKLKSELTKYNTQLQTIKTYYDNLVTEYKTFTKNEENSKLLKTIEKENISVDPNVLEQERKKLNGLNEKRNFISYNLERAQKLVEFKEEWTNREKELKETLEAKKVIDEKIKKLDYNPDKLEPLESKLKQGKIKTEAIMKDIVDFKISLTNITRDIEEKDKKIIENTKNLKTLDQRTKKFQSLLYLDDIFAKFKVEKLSQISPAISAIMSSLISYITDGKYNKCELDENYNIFVERNGEPLPYHMFSGGEKTLLSLVQRLAISQIITRQRSTDSFEFLALDEVVASLDETKQYIVLETLQKLNGIFKQIFMITHNQDLNTMFDYTLVVEQNQDLTSTIRLE